MATLVTGATGFVGSFLVEELLETDREVCCLVRRTSDLTWLRDLPVEFVTWDLLGEEPPPEELEKITEVFHLAGLLTSRSKESFFRVNADGVENLVKALQKKEASVDRFVLVSSLGAVGPSEDRKPLEESDPCEPVSNYGKSKREGELRLLRERDGMPYTIIRPPVVIGPRDTMILDLVEMVTNGVVPEPGRYKKFSFIHVKDLVRGIRQAADSDRAENRVYFLSAPEPFEWSDFVEISSEVMEISPLTVPVPDGVLYMLASLSESFSFLPGLPDTLTRDKALEMTQKAWVCSPDRAKDEIGFSCEHDFESTIRETVNWYRNRGWLPARTGEVASGKDSESGVTE